MNPILNPNIEPNAENTKTTTTILMGFDTIEINLVVYKSWKYKDKFFLFQSIPHTDSLHKDIWPTWADMSNNFGEIFTWNLVLLAYNSGIASKGG